MDPIRDDVIERSERRANRSFPITIADGKLELLNTSGNAIAIELKDIKGVYFVREFGDSESVSRKTFAGRPRTEG